ncbi:MAG: sulfatase [Thermoanaerobaculia bacterium]
MRPRRESILPAIAAVLLTACGGGGTSPGTPEAGSAPLIDVPRRILTDDPVLVVPGTRWDRHPAADGQWRFRTFAKILCLVREPTASPLAIGFRPTAETSEFNFKIAWDGEELATAVRQDGGLLWIDLPPERLAPGRHELTLRRFHGRGVRFDKVQHDNLFEELRWTHGGRERILEPADIPRQRLIAQFVQHGVMGLEQERHSGLLAVAPGSHPLALSAAAARVRLVPENFSASSATFRVSAGDRTAEVEVGPGERGRLAFDAGGAEALTLEVESAGDGPFLWGLPAVESAAGSAAAGAPRPPILLITLDTTRRDALGAYNRRPGGAPPETTPVLDALAARATVFDQAFSTAPWTLPSHASIFTGLYPSKHTAGVSNVQLPPDTETLARLLQQRGYLTAGFSAGELSSSRFGLGQGFHSYRNPDQFETPGGRVTEYVETFLDRHAVHPLFLFVNYFDPHAVFQAPVEFERRLGVPALADAIRELPVWRELLSGQMSSWRAAVDGEAPITPEVRAYLRAAYLAEVAYVDDLVGRLFERLKALGLFERALIVVTADHGELLGEGGYVSHGARLDPELVEIPLIVKWPGQTRGERIGDLVSLVDLFPTILAAAGVAAPVSDGWPLSRGGGEGEPRSFVLLEEHEFLVHPLPKFMKVSPHLFGVQRPSFRQLVWEADQACARRQSGVWSPSPCVAERDRILRSIQAELGTPAAETPEGPLSDELRESLKALGYL